LKIRITVFIVIILFAATLFGNEVKNNAQVSHKELDKSVEINRLGKDIVEKAKSVRTIKSDFKQEKVLSFLSKKIVSGGKFIFEKKDSVNKVKWEYTVPFKYTIVIDGSRIFMKDSNRVTSFEMSSSRVFEEINRIMVGSLNGTILNDSENFFINIEKKGRELNVFMTPRDKSEMSKYFKTIEMILDKNDLTVSRLSMIEVSGDRTDLFFTGKKINGTIDPSEFKVE